MRWDSAIKKLLKIFLFIFSIKIFLKNTLLYLDSQNKERGRQETPLRSEFWRFPASFKADFGRFRPVSAVSVAGQYDLIWPIRPDSGRISPVQCESKPIRSKSSRFGTNRAESAQFRGKKKKLRRGTDARATASDAGAAPSQPRLFFLDVSIPFCKSNMHGYSFLKDLIVLSKGKRSKSYRYDT